MTTLVGIPIGIAFAVVWATIVKTSPTVADEDRVRGWESVVRELPSTAVLAVVIVTGFVLAVRGGRAGQTDGSLRAIMWHGAALLFVLLVVMNGSAENIMTTRPSTVKWLLLPVQVAITAAAVWGARRAVESHGRSGSVEV